jgi:hypothetical protein
MDPPETRSTPRSPDGDAGLRILGMVIGGGAGALLLSMLSTYGHLDPSLIFALPGVGLAVVAGAFSSRRSTAWGAITAVAAVAWTLFVIWLRAPTRSAPWTSALEVAGTIPGAVHLGVVVVAGLAAGAGWTKPPRVIDPDADAEAWD